MIENSWGHKGPWSYSSYDEGPVCTHPKHQQVSDDFLLEPCEHCGCDIEALDLEEEEPEFLDFSFGAKAYMITPYSQWYVLHPCGHIMRSLTAWKVK